MENFNSILYLTAFSCIACDGEIAKKEMESLDKLCKEGCFESVDCDGLSAQWIDALRKDGMRFLKNFLDLIHSVRFSEEEEMELLKIAVKSIYADEKVEYDEVKFFRSIRKRLNLSDDMILSNIEGVEDFWLESDNVTTFADLDKAYFDNINLENLVIEQ